MGDVQVVSTTRISKTSLTLDRSGLKSSLPSEPPAFTLPPRNIRIPLGGTARFEGKVRGYPEPQVTWYRNGQPVTQGDHYVAEQSIRGIFNLMIKGAQEEDSGKYTCEAANESGVRQVTVELTVEDNFGKKYGLPSSNKSSSSRSSVPPIDSRPSIWGESPPKFVTKPSRITIKEGCTGKFSCKITGRPQPQVTWFKGNVNLQSNEHFNMFEKSGMHFLEIKDVQLSDAGTYTCSVENSSGKATASAELVVQGSGDKIFSIPTQSTTSVAKTVDHSETIHTTTNSSETSHRTVNGVFMDKKFSSMAIAVDAKKNVDVTESSSKLLKENRESIQVQKEEWKSDQKETLLKPKTEKPSPVQQKTSSTITLKAVKLQQEPKAEVAVTPSLNSHTEEKRTVTQPWRVESPRALRMSQVDGKEAEKKPEIRKSAGEQRWEAKGTRPQFDLHPQSQQVLEGQDVIFRCKVSGYPKPDIAWLKGGVPLKERENVQIYEEGDLHCLSLTNVHLTDGGSYTCTAINSRGQVSSSCTLNVKKPKVEEVAPVFTSVLKDCTVTEGQNLVLQCSVEGKPTPQVSWLVNDKPIQYAHSSLENGVAALKVQDALPEDGGIYTCVIENSKGRASCSARVIVLEKKTAVKPEPAKAIQNKKTFAPIFLKGLSDLKVMDGSQVQMSVEVSANPPPEIVWLHNGKEIQESEDFHFEKKGNEYILYIQEVFPEDKGKYTCEAWNDLGEAQTQATLTVQEPQDGIQPWFISKPKSLVSSIGDHTLISCAIAGDPFPAVHWFKDGQEITEEDGFEFLQNEDVFTLIIRKTQVCHAGNYEIQLKNEVGDCSWQVSLMVQEASCSRGDVHRENREWKTGSFEEDEEEEEENGSPEAVKFNRFGAIRKSLDYIKPTDEESEDIRGVLKRRIDTKEHTEENIRQQEAEQIDFRTVLGKKVITKTVSEEELKEIPADQMDFRANLQRKVKPKTLEEDMKLHSPQQVDFRSVLGKKGGSPKIGPPDNVPGKAGTPDFRSVLGSKKKPPIENNTNSLTPNSKPEKPAEKNEVNCEHGCAVVDGEIQKEKAKKWGRVPEFTEKLRDCRVNNGEKLVLQCQVSSDPSATVSWALNGKALKSSKSVVISQEGPHCSLTIEKVSLDDKGQYKCTADNSVGKAECSCDVKVEDAPAAETPTSVEKKSKKPKSTPSPMPATENEATVKKKPAPKTPPKTAVPPQILQFPENLKVRAGESIELQCKIAGTPPLNCSWQKFRKQIVENEHMKIENTESTSKLTISKTKHEHCGCYTLVVENKVGSKQVQINVTVVDKPEPPARCPCASDVRSSTLTLSWYGPTYDGGSAVQSYTVEIWDSINKQWTDLTTCRSTSYNIQDLLTDREYKFRVRATNMYGVSEPSQESIPVKVGEKPPETKDEAELSDEEDGEPEYRVVTVNTSQKVSDFYDIEEKLGTGKFGQVYRLVEKKNRKVWAGKFFKAFSAKDKENIRQEIDIMNCLHHPKLVQCVDAFETKTDIVMVMELVSGGELFERIIDEDFELTERECIKYMRQIIDGVQFIHQQGIVHLDLKPENIMCVNKTGTGIKLIDFGLARRLETTQSLKVLFGTPEFVAPEVINYEPIGYATDMWSIGVICYILVSGLSPFMGDNDNETLANVTSATWDFDDEAFDEISEDCKDFISGLLKKDMKNRLSCSQSVEHPWLQKDVTTMAAKKLSKDRMRKYLARRKWQKTGNAVRAIGRLSSLAMISGLSGRKSSGSSPTSPLNADKPETEVSEEVSEAFLEAVAEERQPLKPFFTKTIRDVEVVEGSAARFDCKIEGCPDPDVVWYKDDQPIRESRNFQIDYDEEGNCCLVIAEVSGDDDAKYTCKATNNLGEATCSAELIVEVMEEGAEGTGEVADDD
ncbi:myosin light chain kinase, smooth muscle isoform X2 [Protopterus annectens]|uniref:myosin light chain kinase, smooth muscle isoform X2 n=1 Tax=Protopterus annectens TaxID=7888 RepID=UPI001CFA5BC5|nr:myosin light chain kinase, smooth muscle isoform X2 [Protopterus annectens]